MEDKNIFIHIPKTGGTTLDCAIHGTEWMQNKNVFNYRHIVHETKMSNAGDIFKAQNYPKYKNYNLYMMLRHPVDKVISEYYFVRDRKEYFNLFKKKPKNFTEYIKNVQSTNSTLNFLIGGRFYPVKSPTHADLERVIRSIDELPIYVGIFEEFEKSLEYLRQSLDLKIPKKIDVKRVTLNRPSVAELDAETKQLILEKNKLDLALYNYCKQKLDDSNVKSKSYKITKDRYGYIMKYTERFSLFQLFIPKSEFLVRNDSYLKDLNFYLHQKVNFKEGKKYSVIHNRMLIHDLKQILPDQVSKLDQIIQNESLEDPLHTTEAIAKFIGSNWANNRSAFKNTFKFDATNYPNDVFLVKEEKKSFFGRLFNR